jgi:integrase
MRAVNASNNGSVSLSSNPLLSMTMADFVTGLWQLHKSKLKPSTAYHYDSLLKLYILPAFGSQSLTEIAPRAITLFFAKLNQSGLSGSYKQVIYQLLNTIFETAAAHDLIERSPVRCKLHRPGFDQKEKPTMTADEIRRLIETVPDEHRALFLCVALTGLRVGELLGLWWKDIDFPNRSLKVNRSLWRKQLTTPKTKRSNRTLHMPAALSEVLQMHRQVSRWTGGDDFVFSKPDGAPLSADALRNKVLYPALETIGIARERNRHGFHLFRHSAASIVHAQTRDVSLAQELLGHSRLSTTADIYTHTQTEAEQATEILAREIWGNCGLTVAEASSQVN